LPRLCPVLGAHDRRQPAVSVQGHLRVSLLYFDGCPSWQEADQRLREALARAGRNDVRVERHPVTTVEEAVATGFRGSPTVLVNGSDPFADTNAPVSLSCRVYRTESGLTGSPTIEQLLTVLR